jgi:hypothetical protein
MSRKAGPTPGAPGILGDWIVLQTGCIGSSVTHKGNETWEFRHFFLINIKIEGVWYVAF